MFENKRVQTEINIAAAEDTPLHSFPPQEKVNVRIADVEFVRFRDELRNFRNDEKRPVGVIFLLVVAMVSSSMRGE